ERYVAVHFVVLCERDDIVHRVAAFGGTQQRERGGLVGDDGEFAIERESRALLCASRYHADGGCRLAEVSAVDRDVVRARTSGADQQAGYGSRMATYAAVERGADRDGGLGPIVDEHRGPCAEPGLKCVENAFARNRGREEAPVEQHRVRPNQVFLDGWTLGGPGRCAANTASRTREKRREMAGDRGIVFVRQTQLAETRSRVPLW